MSRLNPLIKTIDYYINQYSQDVQEKLQILRKAILEVVPDGEEKLSYSMPTIYYYGNLVHFAAFKNHIGFYPGDSGVIYFKELTDEYPTSKGAIKFNLGENLPLDLIKKVFLYRKQENLNLHYKNFFNLI